MLKSERLDVPPEHANSNIAADPPAPEAVPPATDSEDGGHPESDTCQKTISKEIAFLFNELVKKRSPVPDQGLTFAIRTDAAFATADLLANICDHINRQPDHPLNGKPDDVRQVLHDAYATWGHSVLETKARHLDYEKFGLKEPPERKLQIHFYNAHVLTRKAIDSALHIIQQSGAYPDDTTVLFISLDDMIQKQRDYWADVGFSRLFDLSGRTHAGYTGRPGMKDLQEQIQDAKKTLVELEQQYGRKIPIVLLEDNVRHAKMLNWVIDCLDQENMFDHGDLAAIGTCFCCAPEEEREKILYNGHAVPLGIVIDYEQHLVDVCTPRDLLLDGFVVDVHGHKTRLSGLFMDVAERFKIAPDHVDEFRDEVAAANIRFCETLEKELSVSIPAGWFRGSDAVAHVTGRPTDTPMAEIMRSLLEGKQPPQTTSGTRAP